MDPNMIQNEEVNNDGWLNDFFGLNKNGLGERISNGLRKEDKIELWIGKLGSLGKMLLSLYTYKIIHGIL